MVLKSYILGFVLISKTINDFSAQRLNRKCKTQPYDCYSRSFNNINLLLGYKSEYKFLFIFAGKERN